jgi:hypothetical protein
MKAAALLLLPLQLAAQGAELDPKPFRYARALEPTQPGPVSVILDAAVLAHSHLDDLRLVDAGNRQIPYVREVDSDPLIVELAAPERVQEEKDPKGLSRYRLKMPYETLPPAKLLIDTPARVFERRVWLEGPRSPRGKPAWGTPGHLWRETDPGSPAPPLELELPHGSGKTVDLLVDEGDNAPLPLGRMRLHLETWTLRFVHPGKEVRLLYGHPNLGAPRYDLALLSSQVGPATREVTLAPEPAAHSDPARIPRGLFWGALVAAVAVLLLVLIRLMREG